MHIFQDLRHAALTLMGGSLLIAVAAVAFDFATVSALQYVHLGLTRQGLLHRHFAIQAYRNRCQLPDAARAYTMAKCAISDYLPSLQ